MTFMQSMSCSHRLAVALLVPLAVLACEAPKQSGDYQKAYPLTVSTKAYTMALTVPAAGVGLVGDSATDFRRFISLYHDRGRSVVTIEDSAGTDDQPLVAARRARDLLIGAGLRTERIAVVRGANRAEAIGSVLMSFTGGSVKVPECGDFSSDPTFNWSNLSQRNFGCAYQRNMGLTIADPGDLKSAKTMSGGDAAKAIGVVKGWRAPADGGAVGGGGAAAGAAAATAQ